MDHRYKKFLFVAETGSFSAAAKQLHVSQPAITLAIASLERAFGKKLYVRKKHTIELTMYGKIVAASAKKMSLEYEKMISELHREVQGEIHRIGIIDSLAHLLSSSKDGLLASNIAVMVDNSQRILHDLSLGKIDLGVIIGQPEALGEGLTVRTLTDESFVFVCAPYLAPVGKVQKIDDWLAINQDSTSYRHFIYLFQKVGLEVNPVFYSTSMDLLKEMAVAGKGTALLPKHLIIESVNNGTLEIVKTKPLYRPVWVVSRSEGEYRSLQTIADRLNSLLIETTNQ